MMNEQPTSNTVTATTAAEHSQAQFITLGTALTLCVFTAVITLMAAFFLPSIAGKYGLQIPGTTSSASRTVSMDFERLVAAGLKSSLSKPSSTAEVEAQAVKFQAGIAKVLARYTDSGVLVVNNRALITTTASRDITESVIQELGLKP